MNLPVRRTRPRRTRRAPRSTAVALVAVCLITVALPADASVTMQNLVRGDITVEDGAPVYAYWSGTTRRFDTDDSFRTGTFTSTEVDARQGLVATQVVGTTVSVRADLGGPTENDGNWGAPWAIPGAPATARAAIAVMPDGRLAVAVLTTGNEVKVTRQVAPGVWAPTPSFTTLVTAARDLGITAQPNGLLTVTYLDSIGASWVIRETAPGVWGTPLSIVGTTSRTSILARANGLQEIVVIGNDWDFLYNQRETSTGVWAPWVKRCGIGPQKYNDVSATHDASGYIQAFGSSTSGIYLCQETSGGWAVARTHTGSYTTVGATKRLDGRTTITATTSAGNLVESTGDANGSAGSWSAWSPVFGTSVVDQDVDGLDAGSGLRLASTGSSTYQTSGTWTSPIIDTGGNGVHGLLRTRVETPAGTTARFQVAASNATPSTFVGPDGTAATWFEQSDEALPAAIDRMRFLRIRASLTGTGSATPVVRSIALNHSLARATRDHDGRLAATAPDADHSWLTRFSSTDTTFAGAASTLRDEDTSTWGTNTVAAAFSTATGCCSPSQVDVTAGTPTATGAAAVAPVVGGSNVVQSTVLQRLARSAGTADLTTRMSLSTSLHVELPVRATLMHNLALGATATQSSGASAPAGRAVDGNTDGTFASASTTMTDLSAQPWWAVDLGSVRQLSELRLWNRTDCCSARLSDVVVLASDSPIPTTSVDSAIAAVHAAGGEIRSLGGAAGEVTRLLFAPGRTARYVQVMLRSRNGILSLAEVEVLGA